MALTRISSNEIQPAAITSDKISASVSLGVKISNVSIANSSYTILDDTAVSTDGGYIVITGAGFNVGTQVIIGTTNATSVTRISSTELRVQVPAKSAATYNLYVVNTDGSTGVRVNGLTYSGIPTWVTASTLANVSSNTAFTGSLSATGATSYANTTALPSGFNLVTANGYYYGNISVGSATTYNFTISAIDAELQDSPRTFTLNAVLYSPPTSIEYLIVGGGGGGGRNGAGGGGGGGAGGYRTGTTSVSAGTISITVGGGGSATSGIGFGGKGTDSGFSPIFGAGGGGGAGSPSGLSNGQSGGSGGGGAAGGNGGENGSGGSGNTPSVSPSQGNNGGTGTSQSGVGYGGGGGGGASAAGGASMNLGGTNGGGVGGVGSSSSISGSSVTYAGGGGGGGNNLGGSGSPGGAGGSGGGGAGTNGSGGGGAAGTTNSGGGGGGSFGTASFAGGSGIVIIRYADTFDLASATTGSPTITTSGGYRIYTFTGSGSITF